MNYPVDEPAALKLRFGDWQGGDRHDTTGGPLRAPTRSDRCNASAAG